MKLPEVTANEIKDWFNRRDQKIDLPDYEIEEIAARGNARAQRLEDEREEARQKYSNLSKNSTGSKPSNKGKLEVSHISGDQPMADGGSTPPIGDNFPVFKIEYPGRKKEPQFN